MAQRTTEELLEDILRQLGGAPGGAPPPTSGSGSGGSVFQDLGLDDFKSALSGPKGAIGTVGKLAKNAGPAGAALSMVAKAGEELYDYMNEALGQFKEFNAAGFSATDGMLGLNKAIASGRLNFQEFQAAVRGSEDVLASFGAEGAKRLGAMNKALIETEDTAGLLALSNQQAASYIVDNLKQQKAYAVFDKLSRAEQQISNREYVDDLNKYSKSLGISTDALSDKLAKSSESVTGLGTQLALERQGLDTGTAAKSAQNLNMVLSSFGNFGEQMNTQFARFLEFGQVDFDSAIGQLYTVSGETQKAFEVMRELSRSGALATEEGQKQVQALFTDKGFIADLKESEIQMRQTYGDDATNALYGWIGRLQNYNPDAEKLADSLWDTLTNDLNRWFEGVSFGAKEQTALAFLNPKAFLSQWMGEDWAAWIVDGSWQFATETLPEAIMGAREFVHQLFPDWLVGYLTGENMMQYFEDVGAALSDSPPSWKSVVRAVFPGWLADWLADGIMPDVHMPTIPSPAEIGNMLMKEVLSFLPDSVVDFFDFDMPTLSAPAIGKTPSPYNTVNPQAKSAVSPSAGYSYQTQAPSGGMTSVQADELIAQNAEQIRLAKEAAKARDRQNRSSEDTGING